MNETITCLTSIANLRDLARQFCQCENRSIRLFLDWLLAKQTNDPRFVALACPANVPVAGEWQGAYPSEILPAKAWGS